MTDPQRHRRAVERKRQLRERAGLLLVLLGGAGAIVTFIVALGWLSLALFGSVAVAATGWAMAASEDTGPAGSGTSGTGTVSRDIVAEVDVEHPDAGQFVPGDPPGTFIPPPPSRDSARDFERDPSRD